MDRDIELAKIQIAGRATESDAQRSLSISNAFLVSVTIFILGAAFVYHLPFEQVFIVAFFAVVVAYLANSRTLRIYRERIQTLDDCILSLQLKESLPTLSDLCVGTGAGVWQRLFRRIFAERRVG